MMLKLLLGLLGLLLLAHNVGAQTPYAGTLTPRQEAAFVAEVARHNAKNAADNAACVEAKKRDPVDPCLIVAPLTLPAYLAGVIQAVLNTLPDRDEEAEATDMRDLFKRATPEQRQKAKEVLK